MKLQGSFEVESLETYDEESVTKEELFYALINTLRRVDRLEAVLGMTMNVVLLATTDVEYPGDEVLERTLKAMSDFLAKIRAEHQAHVEIRNHLKFLDLPE